MSRSSRFIYFLLSLSVAFVIHVGSARAGASADSDRMVVTDLASGAVLFDQSIAEPAAAGSETSLFFSPSADVSPPPPTFNPDLTYVALTEPADAPPETGGEPPILKHVNGTDVIVSDLVIGSFESLDVLPAEVQLLSDGDPNLPQLLAQIPGFALALIEESGGLQDVSGLLRSDVFGGLQVQVQSDVVPEPGTFALLGLGLLGLAAQGRRR